MSDEIPSIAPTKPLKEIIREVPAWKQFNAEEQLQVADALLKAYNAGLERGLELQRKPVPTPEPKPIAKKGLFD